MPWYPPRNLIKKILIHVVDPLEEAQIMHAKFEKTLLVSLGPNALMEKDGLFFFFFYTN